MFSLLQSIYDLVAPSRSQTKETLYDEMPQSDLIETINEVGEKRYIEIPKSEYASRRDKLEVLLKKSQSMLDFCLKKRKSDDDDVSWDLVNLIERARASQYRADDIKPLFDEFEKLKKQCKRGSMSNVNLAVV
jgi:hypothetical protein